MSRTHPNPSTNLLCRPRQPRGVPVAPDHPRALGRPSYTSAWIEPHYMFHTLLHQESRMHFRLYIRDDDSRFDFDGHIVRVIFLQCAIGAPFLSTYGCSVEDWG